MRIREGNHKLQDLVDIQPFICNIQFKNFLFYLFEFIPRQYFINVNANTKIVTSLEDRVFSTTVTMVTDNVLKEERISRLGAMPTAPILSVERIKHLYGDSYSTRPPRLYRRRGGTGNDRLLIADKQKSIGRQRTETKQPDHDFKQKRCSARRLSEGIGDALSSELSVSI